MYLLAGSINSDEICLDDVGLNLGQQVFLFLRFCLESQVSSLYHSFKYPRTQTAVKLVFFTQLNL